MVVKSDSCSSNSSSNIIGNSTKRSVVLPLLFFLVFSCFHFARGGSVQFFNALPSPASLRVMITVGIVNTTVLFPAVDWSSSAIARNVRSGTVVLSVFDVTSTSPSPLSTQILYITDQSENTIGAFGTLNNVFLAVYYDNNTAPPEGHGYLRFINGCPEDISVQLDDMPAFGKASRFMQPTWYMDLGAKAGVKFTIVLPDDTEFDLIPQLPIDSRSITTVVSVKSKSGFSSFLVPGRIGTAVGDSAATAACLHMSKLLVFLGSFICAIVFASV